jgi:hypothetical protein
MGGTALAQIGKVPVAMAMGEGALSIPDLANAIQHPGNRFAGLSWTSHQPL